ncbi:MAG: hypothetical protein ACUVWJ_09590 [Spirochaetota bacterium]
MKKNMRGLRIFRILMLMAVLTLIGSCKPINIFSPFVDPSKLGNDAMMDAGYNALASGNYDDAIEYFSDVIKSASGKQLADAYVGRASAYMRKASPSLNDVVQDLLEGNTQLDDPSDFIGQVVTDNEYESFFSNVQKAADDYNSAIANSGTTPDKGVLLEAYQANISAATGVGAQSIATGYNDSPWGPGDITLNDEMDKIVRTGGSHPYKINTWKNSDPDNNGLRKYVDEKDEETVMLGYLQNAYNAAEQLKASPPGGMSIEDLNDMQASINEWVTIGLNEPPLV